MTKSEQYSGLIKRAALHPVLDNMGIVNMRRTFEKFGIKRGIGNEEVFYANVPPEHMVAKRLRGQAIASMPFGPKALALGWQAMKDPGVYAVVCKYTGNAYIGSSLTPWLRRAVHLYWLKNYWRFGSSNIFFGNLKLAKDIKDHGVDSFYFEIVEHMPNASADEIRAAEKNFLRTHGLEKCYNRCDTSLDHRTTHTFFEIAPDFKALYDEMMAAYQNYFDFKRSHHEFIEEKTIRRTELLKQKEDGFLTPSEYSTQYKLLSAEHLNKKRQIDKSYSDYRVLRFKWKRMLAELKRHHSTTTEPGY